MTTQNVVLQAKSSKYCVIMFAVFHSKLDQILKYLHAVPLSIDAFQTPCNSKSKFNPAACAESLATAVPHPPPFLSKFSGRGAHDSKRYLTLLLRREDDMADVPTEDPIADKFQQHGDAFVGFLGDVQANILGSISAQSSGPEGLVENFQGEL